MEVRRLKSGHDFFRDFPAAITTIFYAAAADYSFGNQKVKIHEQSFIKLSELKKKIRSLNAFYLTFHVVPLQFAYTGS